MECNHQPFSVYYALGSGFGHLSRALKIIETKSITRPCKILFYAPQLSEESVLSIESRFNLQLLSTDTETFLCKEKLLMWLFEILEKIPIKNFYIDTFIAGIRGELEDLLKSLFRRNKGLKIIHIARVLKWKKYFTLIKKSVHFDEIWVLETLHEQHYGWLKKHCDTIAPICLKPIPLSGEVKTDTRKWNNALLVIHSGNEEEVVQLVKFTREKMLLENLHGRIVLASPQYPKEIKVFHHISIFPFTIPLNSFKVIVSGAGFNMIQEVNEAQKEWNRSLIHWVLPFYRRFDDQHFRLKNALSRPPAGKGLSL